MKEIDGKGRKMHHIVGLFETTEIYINYSRSQPKAIANNPKKTDKINTESKELHPRFGFYLIS